MSDFKPLLDAKHFLNDAHDVILIELGRRFGEDAALVYVAMNETEDESRLRKTLKAIGLTPSAEDIYFCQIAAMGLETMRRATSYFREALAAKERTDGK